MTHHNVGIWVDDQKAVMVRLEPDREPEVIEITYDEVQKNNSSYPSTVRPFSQRRLFTSEDTNKHNEQDDNKFYEEISSHLTSSDDAWVFGSGHARQELLNYLIADSAACINYDPSDAFTGHVNQEQIVHHVQDHFTQVSPRLLHIGTGSGREL